MNVLDYISDVFLSAKVRQLDQPSNSCNPDQGYDFRACLKVLIFIFIAWILFSIETTTSSFPIIHLHHQIQESVAHEIGCRTKWDHWTLDQNIPLCSTKQQYRWKRGLLFKLDYICFFFTCVQFVSFSFSRNCISNREHRFDLQFFSFPQNLWQEVYWLDVHGTWRHIHKDWLSPALHF